MAYIDTVNVDMAAVTGGIRVRVRIARYVRFRLSIASRLFGLAARVAGCTVSIEMGCATDAKPRTGDVAEGLPRALSLTRGDWRYREDAALLGQGMRLKLDGEDMGRLAVAYDVDAGSIDCAKLDEEGKIVIFGDAVAIERRFGVVSIERR